MKKLLLLLFIPFACFGQEVELPALRLSNNFYGNYIDKIEKIEVIKDLDYFSKDILWKNTESVLKRGYLSLINYLESPSIYGSRSFTSNSKNVISEKHIFINDDNVCSFVKNYKLFY